MLDPYNVEIEDDVESHWLSLLLKRLIDFKTVSTFKCRNALGVDFTALTHICFSVVLYMCILKHLLLALDLKKFLAKFSSIIAWDLATFISQMGCCSQANSFTSNWKINFLREMGQCIVHWTLHNSCYSCSIYNAISHQGASHPSSFSTFNCCSIFQHFLFNKQ